MIGAKIAIKYSNATYEIKDKVLVAYDKTSSTRYLCEDQYGHLQLIKPYDVSKIIYK